jgi:carboxypeptidase Taq
VRDPLVRLKERLAEISDFERIARLLGWDQQTMMPREGAALRGEHLATLRRVGHELLVAPDTERLLEEVRPLEQSLDPDSDDACLIRVARRDFEKERRVPSELRAEMARAATRAREVWVKARVASDFALLLPELERNFELRQRYVDCFDADEPYDVLLDDFEPHTSTEEVRAIFEELKDELAPMVAEAQARDHEVEDGFLRGGFPVDRQEAVCREVVDLLGTRPDTWRLDATEHPFASGTGADDVRITTSYDPTTLKSLFSTMHEYGHGLYTHQIPRALQRLPIGAACSLGIHESQSRLWENLVGRGRPFWRFFYSRLQEVFPEQLAAVELDRFYAAINRVRPSLIRIRADEVTYGMHIILRFELEQDIVNGRVALKEVPEAWSGKIDEYLGLTVPDDAQGVLQDTHWASGLIGYFPTYLLGTVMSVQIWQKALEDVPDLEEQIERGEFGGLRDWLGDHVHAHGRKFPPQETLRRAVGSTIDPKPYVAYLTAKYGLGVAA